MRPVACIKEITCLGWILVFKGLYWWRYLAIWFQLSCAGSLGGNDPAYGLIVGRVSRSHNHTALWLSLWPNTNNLRFPGYVMHTPQPLLEFAICTACFGQTRCDVTAEIVFNRKLPRQQNLSMDLS